MSWETIGIDEETSSYLARLLTNNIYEKTTKGTTNKTTKDPIGKMVYSRPRGRLFVYNPKIVLTLRENEGNLIIFAKNHKIM